MKKLGRGLDSLIERTSESDGKGESGVLEVDCDRLRANPHQPREQIPEEALNELTESIREHGVLQPVLVREAAGGYEVIAGERRWRAAQRAGLPRIPVLVRAVPDDGMLELALIENIQREDLNPIEKARAYARYVEELGLTHEEAARRLAKERSTVTNQIRLLDLAEEIQHLVSRGTLSMGHARALLGIPDEDLRGELARRIAKEGWSVRETEKRVRRLRERATVTGPAEKPERSAQFDDLERRLRERFTTKAKIVGSKRKGRIVLEYSSLGELDRVLEILLPE